MSERYQVRPNRVGEWCVVDTRTDCTELIIDEVNAKLAAALLNTQANELREAQVDAAALRVAMKEARKLTLTELNTNFAKVATFSVAFETLMNEALESTTAGADLLRNYEHAQQVFRALEQLVAPFDVADELSIDEKVGIVIDTLEDQSAELRAALIDIRDLDDDGALKTGEIAVEALESTTAGAELLRNYEHAQQVFKSLEQIVAPFDIADELSIDERVGMIIGTLKDQNAKLRTALTEANTVTLELTVQSRLSAAGPGVKISNICLHALGLITDEEFEALKGE